MNDHLAIRKVKKSDWDFVLTLRNEGYTNFYKQNKILLVDDHYNYLRKKTKDPNFFHWIITNNSKPIGYCKVDHNDLGIMIKKEQQDQGYGSKALRLVEIEAAKDGVRELVALVMIHNEISKKTFERQDFKLIHYEYRKKLSSNTTI